ncbi:MAG: hypothetical protein JNL01_04515 [Bdellovibrionales bacterium]|nr:hypothetical protein [Bdellovibrionales bacterium]
MIASTVISLGVAFSISSCGGSKAIRPKGLFVTASASPSWRSPEAADLGTFGAAYVQYQDVIYPSPTASPTVLPTPTQTVSASYLDFQMDSNSKRAVWVASLADAAGFRAYGRVYTPSTSASSNPAYPQGWAPVGAGFGILDNSSANILSVAVGVNSTGTALSAFSGIGALADFQSAALSGMTGAWGYFANTIGAVIPAMPFPSNGRARPAGGSSMGLAWNDSGEAFAGYVSSSALNEAYVQRYVAFTGWDAPAATTAVNVGRQAVQMQLLNDGVGVTALWRTEFTASNQMVAGDAVTCAINNGIMRCWGRAAEGSLGRASTCTGPVAPVPTALSTGVAGDVKCLGQFSVVDASAGSGHVCAVVADPNGVANNQVYCWGEGSSGQLGDGSATDSELPLAVATGGASWGTDNPILVSAGEAHTCVVTDDGTPVNRVFCWGRNTSGALGADPMLTPTSATPIEVTPLGLTGTGSIPGIASGTDFTCIIDGIESVICWGENGNFQVDSTGTDTFTPVNFQTTFHFDFVGANLSPLQITAGKTHACMRVQRTLPPFNVTAYCWGDNRLGALGNGGCKASACGNPNPDPNEDPLTVPMFHINRYPRSVGIPTGSTSISAGDNFTCAILATGQVSCWGHNTSGQLGGGPTSTEAYDATPSAVLNVTNATQISAHSKHVCAIDSSNRAWCWGRNTDGQLGDALLPGGSSQSVPLLVSQPFDCASGKCLMSAWSHDSNFANRKVIAENVESFSAATDGQGNVIAAMIMKHPTIAASSCSTSAAGCNYRAYAAVRNTLGQWLAPAQIDTGLTASVTTHYQPPTTPQYSATRDFSTPGIAYLGSGRFLMAYGYTDVTNLAQRVGAIQSRGYTIGGGWDATPQSIGATILAGAQTNLYRSANELKMVSDGQGSALLAVQSVIPSANNYVPWGREMGFQFYRYANEAWLDGTAPYQSWDHGIYGCSVKWSPCGLAKMEAALFPNGEAVVVFPAPADATQTKMRLFSVERK